MGKIISKNGSKNLSNKYSQKLLDQAKQSATDALETSSKEVIQKTAEATGDLIGNKITDRTKKVHKIHNRIIQRQLQITTMQKYQNKIYMSRRKTENY